MWRSLLPRRARVELDELQEGQSASSGSRGRQGGGERDFTYVVYVRGASMCSVGGEWLWCMCVCVCVEIHTDPPK